MRISGVVGFMVASLCLAGCSSTTGVDALQPSNETTSSVVRPRAPVAAAPVETADLAPMRSAPMADDAVTDNAVADNAPPSSMVEEEEAIVADTPSADENTRPQVEPVALMSPPKRLTRAAPAV